MEQRKTCGKRKSADGLHVHGPKNKKTRSWITGYPSQSSGGAAGRGKALRRGRVNPVAAVAVGLVGLGCNDYSGGAAGWPWPGLQVSSFGRRVLLLPGRPKHASVVFSPAEEAQVPRPCLVPNPACPLDGLPGGRGSSSLLFGNDLARSARLGCPWRQSDRRQRQESAPDMREI